MVIDSHNHGDYSEKVQRCQDYIKALEAERCKIQVFQRELPLCLELVTQAIEACKQQLSGTSTEYNLHGQSECSEQTSTEGPVLEEFIPIKRDTDDEEQHYKKPKNYTNVNGSEKSSKKSDWLRSVQLWNQTPDPPLKDDSPRKVSVVEVKRDGSGGAFHPFKREKSAGTSGATTGNIQGPMNRAAPVAAASSSVETGGSIGGGSGGSNKEEKEGQSQRKARRCWSPELHKRFIQALQELGGSHVATPKQIRDLMNVDGLTNDEVKSHLQKYRLHTRRPTSSIHNNNPQAPQFVVVGGIWVPPPEYAAMASGKAPVVATTSNGIYASVPALPPPFHETSSPPKHNQSNSDDQGSHSEGRVHSHSPATSSSTHTTTASLAY
ncbi:transcription factor HHO3-like [Olea europaea var. sylvestris]|uniref:transcription factor HHO3-like n=1 Tax=Olea europaea var. sylvestris TaxID=158386 RepID=UPI000C1D0313|nr:transcription factor HHO3-like [Olea europaea var. sylvestris]